MHYALSQLESVPILLSMAHKKGLGVIAFNLGKHHAYDVGSFSIIRHCCAYRTSLRNAINGLLQRPAMCRASLAMYTHEEVDRLVTGLQTYSPSAGITGRHYGFIAG